MILLTGATGFTGSHLLYFLLEKGNKVRALYRTETKKKRVYQVFSLLTDTPDTYFNQIEWFQTDVTDIPALTAAFEGIEEVYHTAAFVTFNPKHFHKIQKTNVEGTANVVNLCLELGIKKLCHISSIGTLGFVPNQMTTEEDHWNPDDENNVYAISKYASEMEVWRGVEEGLNAVIVNPGLILGSGFWNSGTGLIFKRVSKGLSFYPTGKIGLVDVIDVARICMLLMENKVFNQRYILVSENLPYKEFLEKIANAFETKPPHKPLTRGLLHLLRILDNLRSFFTGKPRTLFKSTVKSMSKNHEYSNRKLVEKTGYTFIPVEETIQRVVRDFKASVGGFRKDLI